MATDCWLVYMIICDDKTLYTGITNDLERRFRQHIQRKGAKYFRARQPVRIVYQEQCADRSLATKREIAIKKLNKQEKQNLIYSQLNEVKNDDANDF